MIDYTSLIAEVTEQTGISSVATKASQHVKGAESYLNKRLRVGDMETTATVTTDEDGFADLPEDFMAMRGVLNGDRSVDAVPFMSIALGKTGYCVKGRAIYSSHRDTPLVLHYYAALPSLVVASNWLLEQEPNAYLYAVMRQVYLAELDAEKAQAATVVLDGLIDSLNAADTVRRYSGQHIAIPGVI